MRDVQVNGWLLPEVKLFRDLAYSIASHAVESEMVAGDDLISKMRLLGI